MSLAESLKAMMDRRVALVAEIDTIDRDLAAVRVALGVPAPASVVVVPAPAAEPKPAPEEGIIVACEVCQQPFTQRSNRQKMCRACREASPHRAVSEITQTQEPDSTCERCGRRFFRRTGQSGRFCSRECYEGIPVTTRRYRIIAALQALGRAAFPSELAERVELKPISRATIANDLGHLERHGQVKRVEQGWEAIRETPGPPPAISPRCSLCLRPFTPTTADQRVCACCATLPPKAAKREPELETVWRPGKDAPSLTGAAGMGSSLGGEAKSHL